MTKTKAEIDAEQALANTKGNESLLDKARFENAKGAGAKSPDVDALQSRASVQQAAANVLEQKADQDRQERLAQKALMSGIPPMKSVNAPEDDLGPFQTTPRPYKDE